MRPTRRDLLKTFALAAPALAAARAAFAELVSPKATPVPDVPSAGKFPHALFGLVLEKVVSDDGLVDYALLEKERKGLDEYVAEVGRVSPESHKHLFTTEPQRVAYVINAHNACALLGVLHLGRPKSLEDGRLDTSLDFLVGGKRMTLRKLTGNIRSRYTDPRILCALARGRRGGPALAKTAWDAEGLDARLDAAAKAFAADERNVQWTSPSLDVKVTTYLLGYRDDVESLTSAALSGDARFIEALNRWRARDRQIVAKNVVGLPFDQRLNDVANR